MVSTEMGAANGLFLLCGAAIRDWSEARNGNFQDAIGLFMDTASAVLKCAHQAPPMDGPSVAEGGGRKEATSAATSIEQIALDQTERDMKVAMRHFMCATGAIRDLARFARPVVQSGDREIKNGDNVDTEIALDETERDLADGLRFFMCGTAAVRDSAYIMREHPPTEEATIAASSVKSGKGEQTDESEIKKDDKGLSVDPEESPEARRDRFRAEFLALSKENPEFIRDLIGSIQQPATTEASTVSSNVESEEVVEASESHGGKREAGKKKRRTIVTPQANSAVDLGVLIGRTSEKPVKSRAKDGNKDEKSKKPSLHTTKGTVTEVFDGKRVITIVAGTRKLNKAWSVAEDSEEWSDSGSVVAKEKKIRGIPMAARKQSSMQLPHRPYALTKKQLPGK